MMGLRFCFYVHHVLIIPALIFSFIAIHIFLFRKAGAAGPVNEDPVTPTLACRDVLSQASSNRYGVCAAGNGCFGGYAGTLCSGNAGTRGEPDKYPLFTPSGVVLLADVPVADVLGGMAHGHRSFHDSGNSDRTAFLATVLGPRPRTPPVAQAHSHRRRLHSIDRFGMARQGESS